MTSLLRIVALCGPLLVCGTSVLAQSGPPGGGSQGPRQVGVMTLDRQAVPVTVTLPGRAVAYHQTAIRPQVGGEIIGILYDPGQPVAAGSVLFRLDDDQLAATLAAAEASVTSAEAAEQGAQATVNRYDRLQGTGVSRADLESAQVALANARAARSSAQANHDLAQLAMDRAQIRSPIEGVVDLASVSVGDLVTANQSDALTTVTQLDPIYVDVAESRARFLRNMERQQQGTLLRGNGLEAELILETGQVYAEGGQMVTPGTTVSATTGTVPFRLEFPNPDRLILPGQFVRVKLTVGTVDGVLVPQRATRRAASGALTAFVARDGKADEVTLTEVGTHQNAWIVTAGVEAGDQLLLDGLTNMTDGTEIATTPVTIDAEGVVRDAEAAGEAGAAAAGGGAASGGAADAATQENAAGVAAPAAAAAPEDATQQDAADAAAPEAAPPGATAADGAAATPRPAGPGQSAEPSATPAPSPPAASSDAPASSSSAHNNTPTPRPAAQN